MASNTQNNKINQDKAVRNLYRFNEVIPFNIRSRLIQIVFDEGLSVYQAAKVLTLNYSTAKSIVRKFKRRGPNSLEKYKNISKKVPQQRAQVEVQADVVQEKEPEVKEEFVPLLSHSISAEEAESAQNNMPEPFYLPLTSKSTYPYFSMEYFAPQVQQYFPPYCTGWTYF